MFNNNDTNECLWYWPVYGNSNENSIRCRLFFSLENLCGIFRPELSPLCPVDSGECSLNSIFEHDCSSTEDILKDVLLKNRIESLQMNVNDVVCIKINGYISCFRFIGMHSNSLESPFDNFVEDKKFVTREMETILMDLHNQNKVISVLDGQVLSLNSTDYRKNGIYCISREVYPGQGVLRTEFMLYVIDRDGIIEVVNPNHRAFVSLRNAIYFYNKQRKENDVLLLDRKELELAADYYQLCKMTG